MMTSTNPVSHMNELVAAALAAEGAERRAICREADRALAVVSSRARSAPLSHHQPSPLHAEQGENIEELLGALTAEHARLNGHPRAVSEVGRKAHEIRVQALDMGFYFWGHDTPDPE